MRTLQRRDIHIEPKETELADVVLEQLVDALLFLVPDEPCIRWFIGREALGYLDVVRTRASSLRLRIGEYSPTLSCV